MSFPLSARILYSTLLGTLGLLMLSCSVDNRETTTGSEITSPEPDQTEWTVMYYGVGNYAQDFINGESRTLRVLRELENVVPSPRVHMVALVSSAATNGHTFFYDVRTGGATDGQGIDASMAVDWGVRDMSSSALLEEFADSVAARCPAKKYMLIVSGDGRGWMGACRDENAGPTALMPVTAMKSALSTVQNPDGSPLRFDLMYWMVPNMGMLEVGYEMSGLARYMISSATTATVEHYRMMPAWLRDLHGAPEIDGSELGRLIMRSCEEAGSLYRLPVEISLLDLQHSTAVAVAMDQLSAALANNYDAYTNALRSLRQQAWSAASDDTSMVDIESLLGVIEADEELMQVGGIETGIAEVRAAMDALRVERLDTRELGDRYGLTLHFPPFAQQLYLTEYGQLRVSQNYPNWTRLITLVSPEYVTPLTLSGLARNGFAQPLVNLGVFLMRGASSFDSVFSMQAAQFVYINAVGDSANFRVEMPLEESPVYARFGLFTDPDSNGFDSGDQFGLGTWPAGTAFQQLSAGDDIDSLFCRLSSTRP